MFKKLKQSGFIVEEDSRYENPVFWNILLADSMFRPIVGSVMKVSYEDNHYFSSSFSNFGKLVVSPRFDSSDEAEVWFLENYAGGVYNISEPIIGHESPYGW